MAISFNTLLTQSGFALRDVRLLRHQDNRADKGKTPYELWRDDPKQFDQYQSIQKPDRREQLNAKYWASFVGLPDSQTLFVGLFRVKYAGLSKYEMPKVYTSGIHLAGTHDTYELILDTSLREFVGKLLIKWGTGTRFLGSTCG